MHASACTYLFLSAWTHHVDIDPKYTHTHIQGGAPCIFLVATRSKDIRLCIEPLLSPSFIRTHSVSFIRDVCFVSILPCVPFMSWLATLRHHVCIIMSIMSWLAMLRHHVCIFMSIMSWLATLRHHYASCTHTRVECTSVKSTSLCVLG